MSFTLIWEQNGAAISNVAYPVGFPGRTTLPQVIQLSTSAKISHTFEYLQNLKLYLIGEDVPLVQEAWPYLGTDNSNNHVRPELEGGLEISFDGGRTYTRFDKDHGYVADSSTWLTVPGIAIGASGSDGVLKSIDTAHLTLRYVIPPGADQFKIYDVRLTADFDIV